MRSSRVLRIAGIAAGLVLLAIGLITAPTPLPVGLILAGTGLAMLIAGSRTMRRSVYGIRRRYPRLSARLRAVAPYLPRQLRRVLTRTDPQRSRVGGAPRT